MCCWYHWVPAFFWQPVDIRSAEVRRPGTDVTLLTYGGSLFKTLDAAEQLAADGIAAEVVDLRTLRPLDDATIMASVVKTHRAVVLLLSHGWTRAGVRLPRYWCRTVPYIKAMYYSQARNMDGFARCWMRTAIN